MSLCTKTHLVSDAGGESPTPTHSSAAMGVRPFRQGLRLLGCFVFTGGGLRFRV